MDQPAQTQDQRYAAIAAEYGGAIKRLANFYEFKADLRGDLIQDIHFALWRSLACFDGRCSLRTWVYRVAHNTAASHIAKWHRQSSEVTLDIEELETIASEDNVEGIVDARRTLERLMQLIHRLRAPDRQVLLLYLEDLDAATIGEIVGMSSGAVATKIHRLKAILVKQFQQGVSQ